MKTHVWWILAAAVLAMPAARAQNVLAASSAPPPSGSALPPPGINEPGAKPESVPLPDTGIPPSVAPAARQRDANGQTSGVAVHTNANGDTVEEYRRGGRVYMVRIIPKNGVTQTYHYNSTNGGLMHDPKLGPVSPVYYDIYKWGKPSTPAQGQSAPVQTPSSGQSGER
ncbi:MAG: DUF2782 domain-containing protein [Rhodanobacteraceae bacterium]